MAFTHMCLESERCILRSSYMYIACCPWTCLQFRTLMWIHLLSLSLFLVSSKSSFTILEVKLYSMAATGLCILFLLWYVCHLCTRTGSFLPCKSRQLCETFCDLIFYLLWFSSVDFSFLLQFHSTRYSPRLETL